jgi:hypothetical protein
MAWPPPPAVMSGLDPVGILAPRSRLAEPVPALSACTAIDVSPSAQVPVQAASQAYAIVKPCRAACGNFVTF